MAFMTDRARALQISFRPAREQDFDYCAELYFGWMKKTLRELKLYMAEQVASFEQRWIFEEVRIITSDTKDIGWLQSLVTPDSLFLKQLFLHDSHQRQGIGTQILHRLIAEANVASLAVTLGVVKTNPALPLYEKLGFKVTHEDDRKFYMQRPPL